MRVEMKILGKAIPFTEDYQPIEKLKFLKDNPMVYAVTHGERGFDDLAEGEQQDLIFEKLKEERSVKNLVEDVKRHGGLMEPILVRLDTQEVIEGNSRLAVYRMLDDDRGVEGEWNLIPCYMVSGLDPREQAAFLNQIHVKGKTQWSAFEKANFAYVRQINGWTIENIADLFGESSVTIRTRINVIELMRESADRDQNHFSHYDVLVRTASIWKEVKKEEGFRDRVIEEIRALDPQKPNFTAQDLRRKLPDVIKKPKVLRRYVEKEIDLDDAHLRAKVSPAEKRVKDALAVLEFSMQDVAGLDQNALNSLKQAVRKLIRQVERIRGMVDGVGARK